MAEKKDWYGLLDSWFPTENSTIPLNKFGSDLTYSRGLEYTFDRVEEEYHGGGGLNRCAFYASMFCALCVDNADKLVVSRSSVTRAFNVFQINNQAAFNMLIDELLSDKNSVIRTFYGFMTEEESRKILDEAGQWLLRMDEDGFIITEAININEDGSASLQHHRLTYDGTTFSLNGKSYAKLHQITEVFPMKLAQCSSPYYLIACKAHRSYGTTDDNPCYISWGNMLEAITKVNPTYGPDYRTLNWALKVIGVTSPKAYIQQCALTATCAYQIDQTIEGVQKCLKFGAEMNIYPNNEYNSIATAVANSYQKEGDLELLKEFLWSNGFDPNTYDKDGTPTLWLAAANYNWNAMIVSLWITHPDVNVNIQNKNGRGHVIHWSTSALPLSVISHPKLDVTVLNSEGDSILDYAMTATSFPVAKLEACINRGLKAKDTKFGTHLHQWIEYHPQDKDPQLINQLIRLLKEAGVNIDSMNTNGLTALHLAAEKGTLELITALLGHGANIHGHPDSETTPLHLAAERGDTNIVKYLIERGADPTRRNTAGKLPKDVAALSAKSLFDVSGASLPQLTFAGKHLPVAQSGQPNSLPFPRSEAYCCCIGEYFYVWGGTVSFNDWFDEYGSYSMELQSHYVQSCWRTKIGSLPLVWENITDLENQGYGYELVTCAAVDGKLLFNTISGGQWRIFDPTTQKWSLHSAKLPDNLYERQMFDRGDKVVFMGDSLFLYDKKSGEKSHVSIEVGDLDVKRFGHTYRVIATDNSYWVKTQRSIMTMNMEKKRWLKSTSFDGPKYLKSFLTSFGNKFILALAEDTSQAGSKCMLFVLDIDSGLSSYHDIDFDYKDYELPNELSYEILKEKNLEDWSKNEPETYATAKQKIADGIARHNFPFVRSTLAVTGDTLIIFGGCSRDSYWSTSDIVTIDLSPLKPYLTLEQRVGIEASKNIATQSAEQLASIPMAIRAKFNLW